MSRQRQLVVGTGAGRIVIPPEALEWQFARSAGPGGQHVNRTSSKAQLRFDLRHDRHLPADVRGRLLAVLGHRLTKDGHLVVVGQRHREQPRNVADCRARFAAMLRAALEPRPVRKRTRIPRSAVAARLDAKRRRARTKRLRGHAKD
jgi:ribosome-associated protein